MDGWKQNVGEKECRWSPSWEELKPCDLVPNSNLMDSPSLLLSSHTSKRNRDEKHFWIHDSSSMAALHPRREKRMDLQVIFSPSAQVSLRARGFASAALPSLTRFHFCSETFSVGKASSADHWPSGRICRRRDGWMEESFGESSRNRPECSVYSFKRMKECTDAWVDAWVDACLETR